MAQHDYTIANQGFPATRADINNVLSAIATNNSGTSAPSTQYAGQFWIDTTSSTWTLYIHDGADDIQFATIDTSANTVNFIDSELGDNSVTTAKIADGNVTSAKLSYPLTTFSSTGIDDNATANAITIGSDETVTIVKKLIVDTDTLVVDNTNNKVGIGTSSPTSELTLGSNSTIEMIGGSSVLKFTREDTTTIAGNPLGAIEFAHTDTDDAGVASKIIGEGDGSSGEGRIAFYTGTPSTLTERMRIVSGGGVNVGSGVLSSASGDGNIVVDDGIYIGTFNGDNQIRSSSAGGGSATLYIGNAAIQVSSDRRLKTNIADTTMSAVDKIKQVRIVDFNWNDPSDTSYNNRNARGTWTGVIAQELIDVFPFAVNAPRNEEDLSIDTESEKKWQVDQAHLVPVLMKAIQEQQTKIEQLEARITALENK